MAPKPSANRSRPHEGVAEAERNDAAAASERRRRIDALLDAALEDTFPASDPVALAVDD